MHRRRYAKIVATLGPASSSSEMIRALFEAGADVFRFNFSHGTHDEHQARYDIVRAIEDQTMKISEFHRSGNRTSVGRLLRAFSKRQCAHQPLLLVYIPSFPPAFG